MHHFRFILIIFFPLDFIEISPLQIAGSWIQFHSERLETDVSEQTYDEDSVSISLFASWGMMANSPYGLTDVNLLYPQRTQSSALISWYLKNIRWE